MLRNLIIVSTSGLLLFSKVFVKSGTKQDQFLGGILIAMLKQSTFKTGLPASYIELSKVGVAVVSSPKIACALFADLSDGMDFAKLLAREFLDAFSVTYAAQIDEKLNTQDRFAGFNSKISEVINNSVRPVLESLQDQKGMKLTMLVTGDVIRHTTQEVEKLLFMGHYQGLLQVANTVMGATNEEAKQYTLRGKTTTTYVLRIERSHMIAVYKNAADEASCLAAIDRTAKILKSILVLIANLQETR